MKDRDKPKLPVSLRDWLAGQALAGILANDRSFTPDGKVPDLGSEQGRWIVACATYTLADEMLKARESHP